MLDLPEVKRDHAGFGVADSGPDLLRELLREYERTLNEIDPLITRHWRPGRGLQDIESRLASVGVPPHDELLVWWNWHDGVELGYLNRWKHQQARLDDAIDRQATLPLQLDYNDEPSEIWLAVSDLFGSSPIAARVTDVGHPTSVRCLDAETLVTFAPEAQATSLSTVITMWLVGIREGWERFDSSGIHQFSRELFEHYPEDWRRAQLV